MGRGAGGRNGDGKGLVDGTGKGKRAKGGKKKKGGKKANAKKEAEFEKARNEMILEEHARLLKDKQRLVDRTRVTNTVAEQRRKQLVGTKSIIDEIFEEYKNMRLNAVEEEEWIQYMKCNRLPDPKSVKQLNTYIYVWKSKEDLTTIETVVKKTQEVLTVLQGIRELVEEPPPNTNPALIDQLIEMQLMIRKQLQSHMDEACYRLLRRLETSLDIESLGVVRYQEEGDHFRLCLWAQLPMPTPSAKPGEDDPRTPLQCEFAQLGLSVKLPKALNETAVAIRVAWLTYDHFSDRSTSWKCPPKPQRLYIDMVSACDEEASMAHDLHVEIMAQVDARLALISQLAKEVQSRPDPMETLAANKQMPAASKNLLEYEAGQITNTPSEVMMLKANDSEAELRRMLFPKLPAYHVNLRRMSVLGGVILLDLFEQPPQARSLVTGQTITVLDGDENLQRREFYQPYNPPPPPSPGHVREPEEIEADMREAESAMESLIYVCISLPDNVLWFEPPTIVGWDEEARTWTSEDYHDIKFNEDKQELSFRAGRIRPLGLAAQRFSNLPFQGYDIRPDTRYHTAEDLSAMKKALSEGLFPPAPTSILISLSCAVVIVEFSVRDSEICITSLQNGPNNALQNIINQYMKPRHLFEALREGGLDLTPDDDVACYCSWMSPKHRSSERHLYAIMALLCNTYNFAWSRWNQHAGPRAMVFQYREFVDRKKAGAFATLQVTPTETTIVESTESSPSYNPTSLPGLPFYADLFHLVQDTCSLLTKTRIEEVPFTLVQTMHEVLLSLRLLSLS